MYALLAQVRSRTVAATEVVCFGIALVIAEIFFKFHSFTLECVAFLTLWFSLGALASAVTGRHGKKSGR
jgi:hypothetical protein